MNIHPKHSNRVPSEIQIDSEHCRAICDEIGERFRGIFGRETSQLPLHLQLLINQLADQGHETAPSIAPSIEDLLPWHALANCRDETVTFVMECIGPARSSPAILQWLDGG